MSDVREIQGASIAWGRGQVYNFEQPNPEIITIEDAAYALAYTPRWRGQTRSAGRRCFFGVGQHVVFGAEEMLAAGIGRAHAFAFLFHEPDEVVLPDFPGPAKMCVPGLREFANKQGRALLDRFDIDVPDPALIKRFDLRMMVTEKRDLMPGHEADYFQTSHHATVSDLEYVAFERRIIPYPHPDDAALAFLALYEELRP